MFTFLDVHVVNLMWNSAKIKGHMIGGWIEIKPSKENL
jgi:hypothetical protein